MVATYRAIRLLCADARQSDIVANELDYIIYTYICTYTYNERYYTSFDVT